MNPKLQMRFDPSYERWCVTLRQREYGLHCGECFSLYMNGKPVGCRLEYDRDWYIIMDDVRFYLRKSDSYTVQL